MIELSVVIITKNQEWNITRLIESVINETNVLKKEIVLVDSASTDKTVQLASLYPIKVIRFHDDQHLSPAAGRYVGYENTKGKYILFLDGDMELYPGWLKKAYELIITRSEVAAITGIVIDLPLNFIEKDNPELTEHKQDQGKIVKKTRGAALYKRSVLDNVGAFNPYLYSDEEPDLSIRIRHSGFKILAIEYPIAFHYSMPSNSLGTKIGRWRRNLYLGAGQNLRFHLGKDSFWNYLRERGFGIAPILALLCGFITIIWFWAIGNYVPILSWTISIVIFIIIDSIRKHSIYKTVVSLMERLFIADGTIRGFFIKPYPPEHYKGRYDFLQ